MGRGKQTGPVLNESRDSFQRTGGHCNLLAEFPVVFFPGVQTKDRSCCYYIVNPYLATLRDDVLRRLYNICGSQIGVEFSS